MKKIGLIIVLLSIIYTIIYIKLYPSDKKFAETDVYDEIMQRGVIKIGINTDSKPFGFIDENNKIAGYDVDLGKYIAQYIVKNSEKAEFIPVTLSNRLIKASTGEVDIVISTITITPQRREIVEFSIPYDVAGQAILVKKNSEIHSLSDLAGQNVGVIFGTTAEKNLKKLVPTANIRGFKSYDDAFKALKSDYINAITSDNTILNQFVIDDKSVKLLPKKYSKEPYGIAFKKGYSTVKLKQNLDYAIKDLQRKNVITRLRKKWKIDI